MESYQNKVKKEQEEENEEVKKIKVLIAQDQVCSTWQITAVLELL